MDLEIQNHCALRVQTATRMLLARRRIVRLIQSRFEKILDPRRKEYYYYDTVNDVATWDKPLLLGKSDIIQIAQTYTDDEAAVMITRQLLRRAALRRVRMLYQAVIVATYDEGYDATYYFNPLTEHTTWELPLFMNGHLEYKYDQLPVGGRSAEPEEKSEIEEEDSESDLSIDSEIVRERRRAKRRYPRSKAQVIIDTAEDNARNGLKSLRVNGCMIDHRVSDRVWDLTMLTELCLAKNGLKKMSSKIEYLVKLNELDVSHNKLTQLPRQIGDLSLLRTFNGSHNRFKKFTAFLFKCTKLETINLEFNKFRRLPVTVGNLELLKATKQWEVGIGVLKNLKSLNLANNLFAVWPEQIERNAKLVDLNISSNYLRRVPMTIRKNLALQTLDLSNNLLRSLPTAIYTLPLRRLILKHNCLEELPTFPPVTTKAPDWDMEGWAMKNLVVLDVSFNRLSVLGRNGQLALLGRALKRLYANDNIIEAIDDRGLAKLDALIDLNLARNRISTSFGEGCVALTRLDMSENLLDEFPPALMSSAALQTLNLSCNLIARIPERLFSNCVLMVTLDLHNNIIQSLPNTLFALRKIVYLDLSWNRISQGIPHLLENCVDLKTLLLGNNKIVELPESISALQALEVLEIENNALTSFPDEGVRCLSRLKRVTTRLNDIRIRPSSLFVAPNLISWDMSWNKTIVAKFVDWNGVERLFHTRKEDRLASLDFLEVLLLRAGRKMGYEMTERTFDDDAICSPFEFFDALNTRDTRRREATYAEDAALTKQHAEEDRLEKERDRREDHDSQKKRKKKAKRLSVEDRRAQINVEENERHKKWATDMFEWLKEFRTFFRRHLVHYSSSSCESIFVAAAEEERRVASLESMTLQMREKRANTGLVTDIRMLGLTSSSKRNPFSELMKADSDHTPPNIELIETLDLGSRFQESIELYESIAKEIDALACIGYMEASRDRSLSLVNIWTQQWQAKYGARALSRGRSRGARNSRSAGIDAAAEGEDGEALGEQKGEGGFDVSEGAFTARSVQFTARSNTSEANELMEMALGGNDNSGNDEVEAQARAPFPSLEEYLDLKSREKHFKDDEQIKVEWNEVALEIESNTKASKILRYDLPASILPNSLLLMPNYPYPHANHSSQMLRLRMLAFRCYFGLGIALLRRIDSMTASIRVLEKRGSIKISSITIAQRLGLDYVDLVADMIDDVWERVIKEDGKNQGSMVERKKRQTENLVAMGMGSIDVERSMDAEGENNDGDDSGKGANVSDKSKASATDRNEKELKKKYYKEMKSQKEAKAAADAAEEEELVNAGSSTTELFLSAEPSISESEGWATAHYINENRQLLIVWAVKLFNIGDEILKLLGWNVAAVRGSFEDDVGDGEYEDVGDSHKIKTNTLDEVCGHESLVKAMKPEVRLFHLLRARSLQYAGQYKNAAIQYNCVLSLGGNKKALLTAEYELIRIHIASREYQRSFNCLAKVLQNCVQDAHLRFPEAWQLIRKFPLLAYWHLLIHEGLLMLKYNGFASCKSTMTFELDTDGILSQRSSIRESEAMIVPQSLAEAKTTLNFEKRKEESKAQRRFEEGTKQLKTQVHNLINTYSEKVRSSKEEFNAAVLLQGNQ